MSVGCVPMVKMVALLALPIMTLGPNANITVSECRCLDVPSRAEGREGGG